MIGLFLLFNIFMLQYVGLAESLPNPTSQPHKRCSGNSPNDRGQWCDYSIDTDYTSVFPDTGVTREYWLELTDVVVSPDGVSRPAMGKSLCIDKRCDGQS